MKIPYSDIVALSWLNLHRKGKSYKKISKLINVDESIIVKKCKEFEKKYPKPRWAISQLFRETGLLEDTCKHGIGHPNKEWLKENDPRNYYHFNIHGCCGCCSK